ncbi:arabinose-5-phosphate isomerase [Rhodoligotrophos appendicifer]|uniref:KpsF/GutQ family sugar-phosphate isomerase n=1 Tax=Rhodoligotrophos appendicifer TaxID=987056 RepID=UPI001186D1B6|nr:KpsF/GutQ family sugar-phosphate isomerase [Rhodoligotrophos appendicifer]
MNRSTDPLVIFATNAVETESRGLTALADALNTELEQPFLDAIDTIERIRRKGGRVIVSGIGKSGIIARKIASTLASTGTPALFVHASEASHGDLGMITEQDVLLVLSNSGETPELADLVAYVKRWRVPLIAITSRADSTIARSCDVGLVLPAHEEACPNGLAPTTSTTLQAALGDALAVTLLKNRGFSPEDFRALHPGGKLGAQLSFVHEVMHGDAELPLIDVDALMAEALVVMTSKRFGCVGVVRGDGTLAGVITDGDLRRNMSSDLISRTTGEVMTVKPVTIEPSALASTALAILNERQITTLFVVENAAPVGILHIHDLLRIGVK